MGATYRTIPDLPESMRPRERLKNQGVKSLSDSELLAILLGSGTAKKSALELAEDMLVNNGGIRYLAAATLDELTAIPGVGLAKATRIKAALELANRLSRQSGDRVIIKSAEDVKNMVMEDMRYLDKEQFRAFYLDRKLGLLGIGTIAEGGLFSAVVHPREVFKPAIQKSAASIILVHNHPSGDPTPSAEDIELTRRLRDAGSLLGIEVLDHVVIGDNKHCSLNAMGLLK